MSDTLDLNIPEGQKDPRDIIVQTLITMWVHLNFQRENWLEK